MPVTITATEAYKNFSEMLLRAHSCGKVIIEKNGKPFVEVTPVARPADVLAGARRSRRSRKFTK